MSSSSLLVTANAFRLKALEAADMPLVEKRS
jgi:hypothetical protein